jgi:hypothetical protein
VTFRISPRIGDNEMNAKLEFAQRPLFTSPTGIHLKKHFDSEIVKNIPGSTNSSGKIGAPHKAIGEKI